MKFDLPLLRRKGDLVLGRTGPRFFFPQCRLQAAQRTTHMYVLGITGQGKSKLLEHCLYQDITSGRGCGVLDPHTDLAHDLLAYLASRRFFVEQRNRERLIYFDPARSDYVIPFNVLDSPYSPFETAMHAIEAFRRAWPESLREAPRFTNILLASLLTLIANRLTLVELPRLLTDKKFRESLLVNVNDPEITSVFHYRLDRWGREQPLILESILNKVSAFTLNPVLRRILGHPENRLDFRRIMDEGKVFIVDLGHCDGETRRLLGSLIVTGMEQAALSRKQEPLRSRRPFYFYVDEFQDFSANEGSALTLAQILSESRKFGLHLTLAHQTLGQMENTRLISALSNIGTRIVFAVDREDAEIMAKKLFLVGGDEVKHQVENELQQEKSHPVYYSLQEEWEKVTQAIQNLRPRTCLVKTPERGVVKLHTVTIPPYHLSEGELEEVKVTLLQELGQPAIQVSQAPEEKQVGKMETTYYEDVTDRVGESRRRIRVTP